MVAGRYSGCLVISGRPRVGLFPGRRSLAFPGPQGRVGPVPVVSRAVVVPQEFLKMSEDRVELERVPSRRTRRLFGRIPHMPAITKAALWLRHPYGEEEEGAFICVRCGASDETQIADPLASRDHQHSGNHRRISHKVYLQGTAFIEIGRISHCPIRANGWVIKPTMICITSARINTNLFR